MSSSRSLVANDNLQRKEGHVLKSSFHQDGGWLGSLGRYLLITARPPKNADVGTRQGFMPAVSVVLSAPTRRVFQNATTTAAAAGPRQNAVCAGTLPPTKNPFHVVCGRLLPLLAFIDCTLRLQQSHQYIPDRPYFLYKDLFGCLVVHSSMRNCS